MELVRELDCWAVEEMGVPAAARAPESTLRRLCLGQGADIWAYVLKHVHSQRSIKKIQGNLLWYGYQDSPEVRRKVELEATAARLRAEIQELDQSLELMDRETETQDMATEQALQSVCDTQRRALLLQAQAVAVRRQQHGLRGPAQRLHNQLKRLQDMERKAKMEVTFGPLTSATLALEPEVLRDVRAACILRAQFLQKLLTPQAQGGPILNSRDDQFGTSYQQWLSSVETLLTNHPPGHVLAALEHLAVEREAEILARCHQDHGLGEAELPRPQTPDQAGSSQPVPSMVRLIQEGWQALGALVTQRGALLKEGQVLTGCLQGTVEEVEKRALDPSQRKALMLGLRCCGLRAELKALRAHSQELEETAGQRQLLLRELQAKQQRILHWRRLVEETQEQIRLLIKGNSASKTRLGRGPGEVLALLERKVVPMCEAVAPQCQELLRCLEEAARHLPNILLGPLLRPSPEGSKPLPTVLPSIHQLHPTSPVGSSLIALSHILGLPAGKAPELLLPKVASLHQDLLFLQDQRELRSTSLLHLKTHLQPGSPTQELLQVQASQEKEQREREGQVLKRLENLLTQALKRVPEMQGTVGDWWEQPGQVALSEELCQGLSLSQWQLRWVQAQGALQHLCK
ncbi:HAUS augmin-like complex subunit 5 [Perognathus longimembris pacificus]|uniref:HAUS augmin-like complex subunit 5 n=1 Tax=Perognathus longimembris pacificus TaxID=214514 RepID=UPI0020188394|nr:HAUS augmin-like complex subunit 5 [Perognathus longimembris pacificus]